MDELRIDAELLVELKSARESVRGLFEQLRLRGESGDCSGKDRLERVPALAKRNFANLLNEHRSVAAREAWRLVDFLEGNEEARLTPLAREGLRPVELDLQLARLRASDQWRNTTARLRDALGASQAAAAASDATPVQAEKGGGRRSVAGPETSLETRPTDSSTLISPRLRNQPPRRQRRLLSAAAIGATLLAGLAVLAALRSLEGNPDPHVACLPLERASESERAAHWAVGPRSPAPSPPPGPARSDPLVLTISDPRNGDPIRSIFTTSQFSFEEGASPAGVGGGKADVRLRVGGWGDTYLSLLRFPLPDNRVARRAVIRLVVLGDEPISRPTTMTLRLVVDPWYVAPGLEHRLWWRDCPRSEIFRRNLPAPGLPESYYDIDITGIYNLWARGLYPNHGIMLEPEHIGSYGASAERYPNFSTFYSTRAIDPEKRPRVILTY